MESLRLQGGPNSAAQYSSRNAFSSQAKSSRSESLKKTNPNSCSSSASSVLSDGNEEEDVGSSTATTPPSGYDEEKEEHKNSTKQLSASEAKERPIPPILQLPHELLDIIFGHLPHPIPVSLLYVCRRFYQQALPFLYAKPVLNVYNYQKFVATISGSSAGPITYTSSQIIKGNRGYINKNYHADNSKHGKDLGSFVKVLDLTNIIQSGKNSYTSRILRRCSQRLQEFYAPQTSFGYSPLLSLRSCHNLKVLDLSLVSETVDLRLLFSAISNAQNLEKLAFPRSSIFCLEYDNIWPPKLWQLCLSGGISNEFIMSTRFPNTVTHLLITHCPFINTNSVLLLLTRLGQQLKTLKVMYPMPALRPYALDPVFRVCPVLKDLSVSVDYISRKIFDEIEMIYDEQEKKYVGHKLERLSLDSSGMLGQAHKIDPIDVSLAILDEKLPKLSRVRASLKLGWNPEVEDVSELAEILEDNGGGLWIA